MPHYQSLPAWLDSRLDAPEPDLARTRKSLLEQGVNSRGWRLYLDYGDALFRKAETPWFEPAKPARCAQNAVAWLKILQACEMDVPPPPELLADMPEWGLPDNNLAHVPPLFLRAAWKACAAAEYEGECQAETRATFIAQQIRPVAHWFFQSGAWQTADAALLKSGWAILTRHCAEWMDEQVRRARPAWSLAVPSMDWKDYRLVGLDNDQALFEEGKAMRHCVGGYGNRCRTSSLRIYSVLSRLHGRRVATISIVMHSNGQWIIDQLKGPGNTVVAYPVWKAAWALLRMVELATNARPAPWMLPFKAQSAAPMQHDVEVCPIRATPIQAVK